MKADRKERTRLLRLPLAIAAIAGAAVECISYVAHGIAYGDVLGAGNMNRVAAAEMRSAHVALVAAITFQFVAVAFIAPLFDSAPTPSVLSPLLAHPSRVSVCLRYIAVFAAVMTVTLVLAAIIVLTLRHLHF